MFAQEGFVWDPTGGPLLVATLVQKRSMVWGTKVPNMTVASIFSTAWTVITLYAFM
jgi:hypothetical protein